MIFDLKLYSNFIDYYDHHFDLEGEGFYRFSNNGMNRIEIFNFLKSHNYLTPKHGYVKQLSKLYPEEYRYREYCDDSKKFDDSWKYIELVVYLDINLHRGENKIKISLDKAIELYPDNYASLFIFNYGISHRYLQIGNKSFWLRYISKNDWRSNCGDVKIIIDSQNNGYHKSIKSSLFAIDFVRSINEKTKQDDYLAIDFNISPGIKGTGIENILKPNEVVDLIKGYYDNREDF